MFEIVNCFSLKQCGSGGAAAVTAAHVIRKLHRFQIFGYKSH